MSYEVPDLSAVVAEQSHDLLFATVSGAHLYGFPSRDSDVDLRGVHVLPLNEVVGLRHGPETKERMWVRDGVEIDLVTHDVEKFCRLLTRPNGYVLEQLLSPLVVHTTDGHRELAALTAGCLTSRHGHHYRGFAATQWRLFERTGEIKPLLYTFRALLTGRVFVAHNVVNKREEMGDFLDAVQKDPALWTTIVSPSGEGMSVSLKR